MAIRFKNRVSHSYLCECSKLKGAPFYSRFCHLIIIGCSSAQACFFLLFPSYTIHRHTYRDPWPYETTTGFPIHTSANALSRTHCQSIDDFVILLLWAIAQPKLVFSCLFLHIPSIDIHRETPVHTKRQQGFRFIPVQML